LANQPLDALRQDTDTAFAIVSSRCEAVCRKPARLGQQPVRSGVGTLVNGV